MSLRGFSRAAPGRASRGFTLVELMVGIGISMVILMATAAMYITTASIGRANVRVSEIQANGQQAMDALRREIINAGFRGLTGDPDQVPPANIAISNDCATGFSMNLRQGVWGANDSNPFSTTCVPEANYLRGDMLAIRRLAVVPTGSLQASRLYLRSAFQAGQFFVGTTVPTTFGFTPSADYLADAAVYFVSPFTVSASESPKVPALYRVRLGRGPAIGAPELVASGVDDLQVQYDVLDPATEQVRIHDAGGAPLDANSVDSTATGWDNVTAVRVFLLVRAQTPEHGFKPGSRSYTLGSRTVTYDDNVPRQVVSSVFSLRNP
jgi:hypothetical protein